MSAAFELLMSSSSGHDTGMRHNQNLVNMAYLS